MLSKSISLLLAIILFACLPKPAVYPYKKPELLRQEAKSISDSLNNYIYGWLNGKNPKNIPARLIPAGLEVDDKNSMFLQKYEELDPSHQWMVRQSKPINFDTILSGIPDTHVTYLLLGTSFAPFGSKVVIEGEFPYCRFFSIQITPPFDGIGYTLKSTMGSCENSIVDADIEPLPGNENPFKPEANRLVKNRKYKVEFELLEGGALQNDIHFKPPYRGKSNLRAGSLIVSQGPWWKKFKAKGEWNRGLIWIRYYAPDKNKGSMAGVPLPKIYYQLPGGEKYFINSDYAANEKRTNQGFHAKTTLPAEPAKNMGPTKGWGKSFGILQSLGIGIFEAWGGLNKRRIDYINKADLGATGRGENQPAPHNYEPHATTNNYATYLGRAMSLGNNKVIILTGKMPTFPDTRIGKTKMDTAMIRYWSIGGYDYNPFHKTLTGCLHSVMDDEVVLDKNRRFIIVYSREKDKPKNAIAQNGVTWVNWGPISSVDFLLRWVSVLPEWSCPFNPHEGNLPWKVASTAGSAYNPKLLNTNDQKGFMGEYLPQVHYMTKKDFESLGAKLDPTKIPDWNIYR